MGSPASFRVGTNALCDVTHLPTPHRLRPYVKVAQKNICACFKNHNSEKKRFACGPGRIEVTTGILGLVCVCVRNARVFVNVRVRICLVCVCVRIFYAVRVLIYYITPSCT